MMKLRLIPLFAGSLLIFTNCIYSKMAHFADDEAHWIKAYQTGDTVLFVSNLNNADTLIVTDVFLYDTHNPFYTNPGAAETFSPNAGYDFKIKRNDSINGGIVISKSAENDSLTILANLHGRFSRNRDNINELRIPIKYSNFSINGKVFKNCMIFDDSNSSFSKHWNPQKDIIKKFVISKKYGLIYYELNNGEIFIRSTENNISGKKSASRRTTSKKQSATATSTAPTGPAHIFSRSPLSTPSLFR